MIDKISVDNKSLEIFIIVIAKLLFLVVTDAPFWEFLSACEVVLMYVKYIYCELY